MKENVWRLITLFPEALGDFAVLMAIILAMVAMIVAIEKVPETKAFKIVAKVVFLGIWWLIRFGFVACCLVLGLYGLRSIVQFLITP